MQGMGLTRVQKKCLDFIIAQWIDTGVPPSFEEMKNHLGLNSKSGVHRIVNALEERGRIIRLRDRARAIMPVPEGPVISLTLPFELEERLRLVAATTGKTPEGYVRKVLLDNLTALQQ